MPRVSVLMPVRNGERFLTDAIDSVLQQNYEDFELVIVDDASTDGTPAVLAKVSDPRVLVVRHQLPTGPAGARNTALERSQGELIALLDADDLSVPNRLERQIAFLDSRPDHVLVGSSYRVVGEDGRELGWTPVLLENDEVRRDAFTRCPFGNSTLMIRRVALDVAGGWNENLRVAEDYDLAIRLMAQGRVANLSEPLSDYRQHSAQSIVDDQLRQAAVVQDALWAANHPPSLTLLQFKLDRHRYQETAPDLWSLYVDRHLALLAEAARRREVRWLSTHVLIASQLVRDRLGHRAIIEAPSR